MCKKSVIYQPVVKNDSARALSGTYGMTMSPEQVMYATDVLIMLSNRMDRPLGKTVEQMRKQMLFPMFYSLLGDETMKHSKVRLVNKLQKELVNG